MLNLIVQYGVIFQSDGVEIVLSFKTGIYIWICESCVAAEEPENVISSVTVYNWFQYLLLVIGTVNITIAEHRSLHITKLVKAEQRMITGAFKVSIIG